MEEGTPWSQQRVWHWFQRAHLGVQGVSMHVPGHSVPAYHTRGVWPGAHWLMSHSPPVGTLRVQQAVGAPVRSRRRRLPSPRLFATSHPLVRSCCTPAAAPGSCSRRWVALCPQERTAAASSTTPCPARWGTACGVQCADGTAILLHIWHT